MDLALIKKLYECYSSMDRIHRNDLYKGHKGLVSFGEIKLPTETVYIIVNHRNNMVEINLDNGPALLMKSPVAFTDKLPLSFNTIHIGEVTASEKEHYSILCEESTIIRETIKLEKINSIYMDEHFGPLLDKRYHSDLDEWLFKFKLNPETFNCFKFEEKQYKFLKFSPIVFTDKLIPRTIGYSTVSPCSQYLYSNSFVASKNSIERIEKDILRIESYKQESINDNVVRMRTELCNEYKRKLSTIDDIEVLKSMKSH